jgi:hypothetical protein
MSAFRRMDNSTDFVGGLKSTQFMLESSGGVRGTPWAATFVLFMTPQWRVFEAPAGEYRAQDP